MVGGRVPGAEAPCFSVAVLPGLKSGPISEAKTTMVERECPFSVEGGKFIELTFESDCDGTERQFKMNNLFFRGICYSAMDNVRVSAR